MPAEAVPTHATVEIVTVTPEMAADWLLKNTNNRPLSDDRVAAFVTQMQKGAFMLVGDSVMFDTNGRLVNGQHRLTAIVRFGKAVQLLVMRNAKPEVFMVTDIGLKKSGGQALRTLGEENVSLLASLARVVSMYISLGGDVVSVYSASRSVPPNEIIDTVAAYPILRDIVKQSIELTRSKDMVNAAPSVVGLAMFIANEAGHLQGFSDFLTHVAGQANLRADGAAIALRRRLANIKGYHHQLQRERTALLIKAYRYHLDGRIVQALSWRIDENFPQFPSN